MIAGKARRKAGRMIRRTRRRPMTIAEWAEPFRMAHEQRMELMKKFMSEKIATPWQEAFLKSIEQRVREGSVTVVEKTEIVPPPWRIFLVSSATASPAHRRAHFVITDEYDDWERLYRRSATSEAGK